MTISNRVLAAEDSPTQAAQLRSYLEEAGFDVTMVGDGVEALAMLHRERFDIVVSDVVMPGMDGYELCRAVKDHDVDIPVVLLTSMTDPLDVVHALSAGADNFLRKPYEATELVHRVRNMLFNKELRQSGRTQIGLELFFLGRRFMINSDREQILDLLVSTFEDLVSVNEQLRDREDELARNRDEIEARWAETELERERLQAVLSALPQGLAVMDADGRVVEANQNLGDLVGVEPSALIGMSAWDAVHLSNRSGAPADVTVIQRALAGGASEMRGTAFDLFLDRPDGSRVPIIARSAPVRSRHGAVVGSVGVVQDIAELSAHDQISGLPGHSVLMERLRGASASDASMTGLLVIAIDRFQQLRAALPGGAGDEIVTGVVSRLRESLRSEPVGRRSRDASAAYLGNGDLAVLATDIDGEHDAIIIGELLAADLAGPMKIGDLEVEVDVSVGVGMFAADTDPAEMVSTVATAAHRVSGEVGARKVAASDPTVHAAVVARLQREGELRRGLAAGQIVAHYQPQVRLRAGQPVAVEALARWEHPDHGLLGAGEIIPLAIESGLICRLGWTMLEQACRQAQQWRQDLPDGGDLQLSVNVAAQQLGEPDVVERVARILDETGLEPTALILEITETSVMGAGEEVSERLRGIKALGVQLAIDDFGTGYSSLLQLRHLPVDILKIDRAFVSGMIEEPADAAIVAGTVSLARALGLELVAEGVETMEQLVQLRILGCDHGQGYYWARPFPPEELARWWSQRRQASSTEEQQRGGADDPAAGHDDDTISYLIHELRSPLTAISGFADLLSMDDDVGPPPELVAGIRRNAQELETRLASVTEARHAEQGGLTLHPEPVDLVEVVRTVVEDLGPQLEPHRLDVATEGTVTATVDRSRVVQALTNLLTNAAKFSPGDTPIGVSVGSEDDHAVIRVRDRGPGIPAHRRPELFRRFSRLGSRNKGMGVGLYLARLIAVAHGGSVHHEAAPGGGSVFVIRFPQDGQHVPATVAAAPPDEHELVTSDIADEAMLRSVTIVQIEDNHAIAQLVDKLLSTRPGVDVHTAHDGASGVDLARRHRPDLVFLDLNLPDLTGEEVLRQLRDDPRTATSRVVIVSADIAPTIRRELESLGAVDTLRKPFDIDEVFRIVDQVRGTSADPAGDAQRDPDRSGNHPAGSDEPLDPKIVGALREIAASSAEPGGLADTVRAFSADADQHLRRLQGAAEEVDPETFAAAAHTLVGLTASFGAHIAAEQCQQLLQLAHEADRSSIVTAVDRAVSAVREADDALRREFCR